MAVTLAKGQSVSLAKTAPGLSKVLIGLGWDVRSTHGDDFDLDVSAFLVNSNEKVLNDSGFIFYNQLTSPDGSVQHQGDNRTGAGDGDDEAITVDLNALPREVEKVIFTVSIHEGKQKGQNFGSVENAYVRIVDETTGNEVPGTRYDLREEMGNDSSVIFAELYRDGSQWNWKALGQGFTGELLGLAQRFGVNV